MTDVSEAQKRRKPKADREPHARSGDAIAISSYLGKSNVFDRAMASFAATYADRNERDCRASQDGAASGRVSAHLGI